MSALAYTLEVGAAAAVVVYYVFQILTGGGA